MTRRTEWPAVARCVCGFVTGYEPTSAAWHRLHKQHHMAAFPHAGDETVQSLDVLIRLASEREARQEQSVS